MKIGIKIIIIVMIFAAFVTQVVGDNLLITVGLLWFTHVLRSIDNIIE